MVVVIVVQFAAPSATVKIHTYLYTRSETNAAAGYVYQKQMYCDFD